MIEPVDLDKFFIAFFSAAMIILMGACYAIFFTLHKLTQKQSLLAFAYLSYALLVVSVMFLSDALHLHGYWQFLVWVMVIGYLLAPHGIWHLCRGTHAVAHDKTGGDHDFSSKGI